MHGLCPVEASSIHIPIGISNNCLLEGAYILTVRTFVVPHVFLVHTHHTIDDNNSSYYVHKILKFKRRGAGF